jgi:predicted CoA-binding protein
MIPTLVIGASENPDRYSNKAIKMLHHFGHEVLAFGKRKGEVEGFEIATEWNENWQPHTITLYINPTLQLELYDKIISLRPERVIFNPGTENKEFESMLEERGIQATEACTLVLLSTGQY